MLREMNEVRSYFNSKFKDGNIPDGVYAIPTQTSKGMAFMKMEVVNELAIGKENFMLFLDEALTQSWYN